LVTNQETEMNPATSQNITGQAVEIPGLASRRKVQQPERCHPHAPAAPAFQRGRRAPAHKPVRRKNKEVRPAQGTEGYQAATIMIVWPWQGA